MNITLQQFASCMGCTLMTASFPAWHEAYMNAMAEFGITEKVQIAQFFAQTGHESTSLSRLEENLNYSAQRLMEVWPSRFPTLEKARYYEHNPQRIANQVYSNRNGNGPYESGDGYTYRGRGPIQCTGKKNYGRVGTGLNLFLIEMPDLLGKPENGARSAAWLFVDFGCLDCADDCDEVSDRINLGHHTPKVGDAIGYADRKARFDHAMVIL